MDKNIRIYKSLKEFMHEIQIRERKKLSVIIWAMYILGMIVGYLAAQVH